MPGQNAREDARHSRALGHFGEQDALEETRSALDPVQTPGPSTTLPTQPPPASVAPTVVSPVDAKPVGETAMKTRKERATAPPPPNPRGALPASLKRLGNEKQWNAVHEHFQRTRDAPLVVWGPVGCGKTRGAKEYFEWHGYKVVEVDGADASGNAELTKWIHRFRESRTQTPIALLLDDFEGFTSDGREIVATVLKEQCPQDPPSSTGSKASNKRKKAYNPLTGVGVPQYNPVVITCNQPREPSLSKHLASFRQVRLFAPSFETCHAWFHDHHVWEQSLRTSTPSCDVVRHRGFPVAVLVRERETLARGDLRRSAIALEWSCTKPVPVCPSDAGAKDARASTVCRLAPQRHFANIFDASRQLLHRRLDAMEWAEACAEGEWDVSLLQYNLPGTTDVMERLSEGLDAFSEAQACLPDRYELREAQRPYTLATVALAARLTSQTRDVGALVPPPRETRVPGSGPERSPGPVRDLPAILLPHDGPSSRTGRAGPS